MKIKDDIIRILINVAIVYTMAALILLFVWAAHEILTGRVF